MNKTIVILAIVLVLTAFVVGTAKGSAGEKEDKANENAAIDFLKYKPLTTLNGFISYLSLNPRPAGKTWFSPMYHLDGSTGYQIAKDIYDAKGFWNDDETLTYSALARLHSLADIMDLNTLFQQFKKVNIFDYMVSYLNDAEMARCAKVLQSLPIMIDNKTKQKIAQP